MSKKHHQSPQDVQQPQTGKVENDFNKQGEQVPTQKNEGRRTPESRHDREAQVGGSNQHQVRASTPQGDKTGARAVKR